MEERELTEEEWKEKNEQRLRDWEYCGIKGSDLMQKYPYLMKYPPWTRIKKMQKLAVSDMKDAMTLKVLEASCSQERIRPDCGSTANKVG